MAARRAAVPPGHWLIGDALSRLGASLTLLACFEEAEETLLDAYAILHDNPQARSDIRSKVVDRLNLLYEAWGCPDRTAALSAVSSASRRD